MPGSDNQALPRGVETKGAAYYVAGVVYSAGLFNTTFVGWCLLPIATPSLSNIPFCLESYRKTRRVEENFRPFSAFFLAKTFLKKGPLINKGLGECLLLWLRAFFRTPA